MKLLLAALCAMLVSVSCAAAESCPPTNRNLEWSSACFEGAAAARHVKREYLANIVADKTGHATIAIEQPRELVAVDRRGAVVVPNIRHTGDVDYPTARGDLGRFQAPPKNKEDASVGKCGYFNTRTFQIVIPAVYDHCMPFDEGAEVCNDCKAYCIGQDCQDSTLVGGQGFVIDSRNRIVRRFMPPPLEQACSGAPPVKVVKLSEAGAYMQCPPGPFDQMRPSR